MADINARIAAKIQGFTEELQALIGAAVREHVENALASFRSGAAVAAPKAAKAAKAPKAAPAPKAAVAAPAAAAAAKAPKASRRKGAKRSAAEIEKTITSLQAFIASKPGQRMEQIGAALSTATKDLTRPLQKLLEAGSVRREGAKRASRYYPTTKDAAAPAVAPKVRAGRKPTGRKPGRPKKS